MTTNNYNYSKEFRTAWMAKPNGELVLITPYGDDK